MASEPRLTKPRENSVLAHAQSQEQPAINAQRAANLIILAEERQRRATDRAIAKPAVPEAIVTEKTIATPETSVAKVLLFPRKFIELVSIKPPIVETVATVEQKSMVPSVLRLKPETTEIAEFSGLPSFTPALELPVPIEMTAGAFDTQKQLGFQEPTVPLRIEDLLNTHAYPASETTENLFRTRPLAKPETTIIEPAEIAARQELSQQIDTAFQQLEPEHMQLVENIMQSLADKIAEITEQLDPEVTADELGEPFAGNPEPQRITPEQAAELQTLCMELLDTLGITYDQATIIRMVHMALPSPFAMPPEETAAQPSPTLADRGTHEDKAASTRQDIYGFSNYLHPANPLSRLGRFALDKHGFHLETAA